MLQSKPMLMKLTFNQFLTTTFLVLSIYSCKKKQIEETAPDPVNDNIISQNDSVISVIDTSYNIYTQIQKDSSSNTIFYYGSPPEKYLVSNRGWQGCPNIGYENGTLYVGYYCGVTGESAGNYISIATSNNMGITWTDNSVILAPKEEKYRNFEPCFWKDQFNMLHLSWATSEGLWDGGLGGTWQAKIRRKNGIIALTKPNFLFHGIMNVQPLLSGVNRSKIYFPVSVWNLSPVSKESTGAFIYESKYDSITKQITTPKKISNLPTSLSRTFDEHMLVDLGGGNYTTILRTDNDGLATMKTFNTFQTWDKEKQFTDIGPTTSSRFYFGRLKSGNLILVLNNSNKREKMTAFLSKDEGKTWPYKLLLDSRLGPSYPDLTQNESGDIFVVFDYARPLIGHIMFTKFTENDIISGDESKIYKTIISKIK